MLQTTYNLRPAPPYHLFPKKSKVYMNLPPPDDSALHMREVLHALKDPSSTTDRTGKEIHGLPGHLIAPPFPLTKYSKKIEFPLPNHYY
jgi:hypothetical protein